jgi:predicted alpha/beta superfamily hydrolase
MNSVLGTLANYESFASRFIDPRPIVIWCPPDYETSGEHYPVLYMRDGQNLFDATSAYGGIDWGMDETVIRLMEAGEIPGVIIVGEWNNGINRWREYMPQKALKSAPERVRLRFREQAGGDPISDLYLRFLVEELKPFVDSTYRTLDERTHTMLMGSSMGALLSLYALEEYPQIFGGAGCLSTHWPAGEDALVDWMGAHLPSPGLHKIYFDHGTVTLDAQYEPYQQHMDDHLQTAGYHSGVDWMTCKFEGAEHNEAAWRERVHIPLKFLLG